MTQNVVTNVSGKRRTPVIIPVTVTRRDGVMPASNVVNVSATYLKDGNNPRVATCKFEVSIRRCCSPRAIICRSAEFNDSWLQLMLPRLQPRLLGPLHETPCSPRWFFC